MLRLLSMCVLAAPLLWACSGGAPVGAMCAESSDCAAGLQCFAATCAPLCQHHDDCGDGFVCDEGGECRLVESALGDSCQRGRDCGPGQRCQLETGDADGDGRLAATCQAEAGAGVIGAACAGDGDCRSGTCVLGLCTEPCQRSSDCAADFTCAAVPRLSAGGALFDGCLPAGGVVTAFIDASAPQSEFAIAVPEHARSLAIVSRVASSAQLVGVSELRAPDGTVLHRAGDASGVEHAPVVHEPGPGVSTLLLPNTDRVELTTGVYRGRIEVTLPGGGAGTLVPEVEVHYKLGDEKRLDLELVFLDLADHPCRAAWGGGALSARTAPDIAALQHDFLGGLAEILAGADLSLGRVSYRDLARPDLDALPRERAGELFALSSADTGVTVFVVRSIAPVGIQALSGGTPGPPRTPGTSASGIALSADTLCYRSWRDLARTAAHTLASQMGLYPNRSPEGEPDPIADSDDSADNLMYFGEFGGVQLSEGQRRVLGRYPGLR